MDVRSMWPSGWRGRPSAIVRTAIADLVSALVPFLILLAMIAAPLLLARIAAHRSTPHAAATGLHQPLTR